MSLFPSLSLRPGPNSFNIFSLVSPKSLLTPTALFLAFSSSSVLFHGVKPALDTSPAERQTANRKEWRMSYGLHTRLRLKSGFFPIFSASHIIAWLIFSLWYPNITCSLTVTYSDIPCLHTHICFPFPGKTLHWRPYLYLLNSHLTNFNHFYILWRSLEALNLASTISKAYWSF